MIFSGVPANLYVGGELIKNKITWVKSLLIICLQITTKNGNENLVRKLSGSDKKLNKSKFN